MRKKLASNNMNIIKSYKKKDFMFHCFLFTTILVKLILVVTLHVKYVMKQLLVVMIQKQIR